MFGAPDFTIYNAGAFPANRYTSYMTSSTSIDVSLKHKEMVILGTQYAGEMKKGIFSLMNYMLPKGGILSLHSGAGARTHARVGGGLAPSGRLPANHPLLLLLRRVQRGEERRRHHVLWPVWHGQDHAVRRPQPPAHRRRRARLERQWRVQH